MINPFFYRGPSSYYPYYKYGSFPYEDNNVFSNKYHPGKGSYYNSSKGPNYEQKSDKKINISNAYVNNFKNDENSKNPPKSNSDKVFEIFGIKLFFDDILLISLIFFLYNEGVQDKSLFIVLILILLS